MAEDFFAGLSGGLETGILAGVATGDPTLGWVAGGLGFLSNMFGSRSRRKAAGRLAAANREAAKFQFAASMKALDMWNGYLSQMTQQFKPWRVAGLAAMDMMMQNMGITVPEGTFDIGPDWDTGVQSGNIGQMIRAIDGASGANSGTSSGGNSSGVELPLAANAYNAVRDSGVDLPLVANLRKLF